MQINDKFYEFRNYIHSEQDKVILEEIYKRAVEDNKTAKNVVAFIPTSNIEEETLDITDFQWCEDYEVRTGTYSDGENTFSSKDEAEEFYKKQYREEHIATLDVENGWSIATVKDIENIIEEGYDSEEEANERINELADEYAEEKFDELDDFKEDEIMWNTIYRYNQYDADIDTANKLGLAVVEFTNHDSSHCNDMYLGLTGCGMDLSPKFVAYKALEFKRIDDKDVHHFQSKTKREYFRYVVGRTIYKEVLEILGIADMLRDEIEVNDD